MSELPISCELTPAEIEQRRQGLLPGLLENALECVSLAGGFRWRFKPGSELLAAMIKVIDQERQCCLFLRFQLTIAPDSGPIWLEVTGPEGTAEFLQNLTSHISITSV